MPDLHHIQTANRPRQLLVTAPTLQPRHHPTRAPWGTIHARVEGAGRTLCGLPTTAWYVFWDLEFIGARPDACTGCADASNQLRTANRARGRQAPVS